MTLSIKDLVDEAVLLNIPPSNYFTGWDIISNWQMNILLAHGMTPRHSLLDIGCGAMRLGISAVEFLNDDGYYGVDPYRAFLDLARTLAKKAGIVKKFNLLETSAFEFNRFGRKFDFAIAQSVFTHLSLAQIEDCMKQLQPCMNPGAKFIFTYTVGAYPTASFMFGGTHVMERPWIENLDVLAALGARYGAKLEALDTAHPTGQSVAMYRY